MFIRRPYTYGGPEHTAVLCATLNCVNNATWIVLNDDDPWVGAPEIKTCDYHLVETLENIR